MSESIKTEVLIIGSGIAGGIAALTIADNGIPVTIISRSSVPKESNTYYAQGGIVYKDNNESGDSLEKDIHDAGGAFCKKSAVDTLISEGAELVRAMLMERLGIEFDKNSVNELSLNMEGKHSLPRILHVSDTTGKTIENALISALKNHKYIHFLENHTAIDLLTPHHHSKNKLEIYEPLSCVGAYVLNRTNGIVHRIIAKKTILAAGGMGQIFLRTTNPVGSRGDGLAMAYRAGARVINSEFIQFHPTMFYAGNTANFLISEAVRGEGARLTDSRGVPFMDKYDKKWKDLAARDLVSRSIHQEMLSHNYENVYLDMKSYIPQDEIRSKFPNIYKKCLEAGVDITKDLIPVVPAAHYAIGGVWVDEWGKSTVKNLYAVGEVACSGVHGANRLASTSLLEGLVWGHRSAKDILKTISKSCFYETEQIFLWENFGSEEPDPALIQQDLSNIKHIMWNYVGLVRNRHRLDRAIRELKNLENEIERFYRRTQVTDSIIGLRNAVRVAIVVALAAWENKSSMGCHYRED